ncbi:MAG: triose-phosphate isomerase [Gammaproteobacteria bacterium]|nr:triose-phosphate isomerase [Gammaproteobacteria bacterium]
MPNRRPFVAGNWKLNGSHASSQALVSAVGGGLAAVGLGRPALAAADGPVEVLVCPPFVYLAELAGPAAGCHLKLGAQDVAVQDSGAFTGEVSAAMLRDVGCEYVIVGHSERRALFGDTDERVAGKVIAALRAGLAPILCVGETLGERDAGQTLAVVRRQLDAVFLALELAGMAPAAWRSMAVAYEPVWAIGTGRTATPEQAQEVHADIRATVARRDATISSDLRILYGGSVKASNAKDLFAMRDIDGGLIGGASLQAAEFVGICKAAAG